MKISTPPHQKKEHKGKQKNPTKTISSFNRGKNIKIFQLLTKWNYHHEMHASYLKMPNNFSLLTCANFDGLVTIKVISFFALIYLFTPNCRSLQHKIKVKQLLIILQNTTHHFPLFTYWASLLHKCFIMAGNGAQMTTW